MDWCRPDVIGCYPYDFTMGDVFAAVNHRTMQGRKCPGSELCTRAGPLKLDEIDRMTVSMESVKRETDYGVVKVR